ncbi:MAG: 4-hydroxy-3-methylbut-2-enyl diphosphate reductase [Synergistaceae bacterium]
MEIYLANPTGLCFGVKRAINTLEEALLLNENVYSLGSPIHNSQEVERLKKLGLIVVKSVDDIPDNEVSFVRAHGVTAQIYSQLKAKSKKMVDGTCPFVKTAQERASALSKDGYIVVILGDVEHPEVKGIMGYASGEVYVLSEKDKIPGYLKGKKIGILSQTTQKVASFTKLVEVIRSIAKEVKVYNTICKATLARQEAVSKLALFVDKMIIIGGKDSANTQKLVEISLSESIDTQWIEHPDELNRRWLKETEKIGIAAGGSTPDWLIKKLTQKLKEM